MTINSKEILTSNLKYGKPYLRDNSMTCKMILKSAALIKRTKAFLFSEV